MKRYPEYKDSGVEWIGDIPEHWVVGKLNYYSNLVTQGPNPNYNLGTPDEKFRVLKTKDLYDDVLYYDKADKISPETFQNHTKSQLVRGDFLIAIVGKGSIGKVNIFDPLTNDIRYIFSRAIGLIRPNSAKIMPHFLNFFFRSGYGKEIVNFGIDGSTGQEIIKTSYLKEVKVLVPPKKEQDRTSKYLDHKIHLIDTLIEKKQKHIELLKEQRAALIHDADQDPSTRSMRIGHVVDQIFRPIARRDNDIYMPVGLYNRGRGIFHKEPTIGADLGDSNFFWIEKDDLILSGQFAWEGAVALASEKDAGCVATHRYPILRGKPNSMETAYLFAFFTTKAGDFLLNQHSRGAAGRNRPLNAGTLLKESIPVPPMTAQARVSAHVYFERRIRPIVARSVQLLQEYRTALISNAVTGKIDVRDEVIP